MIRQDRTNGKGVSVGTGETWRSGMVADTGKHLAFGRSEQQRGNAQVLKLGSCLSIIRSASEYFDSARGAQTLRLTESLDSGRMLSAMPGGRLLVLHIRVETDQLIHVYQINIFLSCRKEKLSIFPCWIKTSVIFETCLTYDHQEAARRTKSQIPVAIHGTNLLKSVYEVYTYGSTYKKYSRIFWI